MTFQGDSQWDEFSQEISTVLVTFLQICKNVWWFVAVDSVACCKSLSLLSGGGRSQKLPLSARCSPKVERERELMMQLPQKSRLLHSDGRRGEIKFLWELGNPKNENHWKLTCPRHLPSHVDLHYLARAPSTFDKSSFHRRAAKGCNDFSDWMRSDSPSFSSLTTHQ